MPEDSAALNLSQLLAGKTVVVTGASSGIGHAIALAVGAAGADVGVTYRKSREGAEAVAAELRAAGRTAVAFQADVSVGADLERLTQQVSHSFDRVDAWINNAGADILTGPGAKLSRLEKLDLLLAVDLRGTMLASWAAAGLLRNQPTGGAIINMSWDGVLRGLKGENPELFSAVKGGVLSFSRSLARSLAPQVRVNVLGPGWIETAFGETASNSFKERVAGQIPLGRWGTPGDVAGAAVYLCSDLASYVTGQMIVVNGGDVM